MAAIRRISGGSLVSRLAARVLACVMVLLLFFGDAAVAQAEEFPSRPVRIVIPQPPGSSSDLILRSVAQKLSEKWGQSVIVDNRPGGGTLVASSIVARAAPDGYTLLFTYTDHVFYPSYHEKMPYDVISDFIPITTVASLPVVFIVPASLHVSTVSEFLALARKNPGQLNFGSVAPGGSIHLMTELFKSMTDIDIVHVPYAGTSPALTDLLAGRIQLLGVTPLVALPYIKSGEVRAIGVTSPQRIAQMPEVPTLAESGVTGYAASVWYGFMAPAKTPRALVDKLNADIIEVARSADVTSRLAAAGAHVETRTPEEFSQMVKSELTRWTAIIKAANIRIN